LPDHVSSKKTLSARGCRKKKAAKKGQEPGDSGSAGKGVFPVREREKTTGEVGKERSPGTFAETVDVSELSDDIVLTKRRRIKSLEQVSGRNRGCLSKGEAGKKAGYFDRLKGALTMRHHLGEVRNDSRFRYG